MKVKYVQVRKRNLGSLWKDYWGTWYHHDLVKRGWPAHRLACFLTADEARTHRVMTGGDGFVVDKPEGRRPFLGALTNSASDGPSTMSGALEYNEDGHLLTIAPTRSGKGVTQIIPNLLNYAGSCVVIDIKGENYAKTGRYRGEIFPGAAVYRFAPFDDETHCFNPLDFIRVEADGRPNSYTLDDTRLLSELLIPDQASSEKFWITEARTCLSMLIFYVATRTGNPLERTMRSVMELLFPDPKPDEITEGRKPFAVVVNSLKQEAQLSENGLLTRMVVQFEEHDEKVRSGVLSTCRSAMGVWLSERLLYATHRSDFTFADLKKSMCRPVEDNPAPTSLFLVIPPEYLHDYRSVLRTLIGLATVALTREHEWDTPELREAGWRPKPPCPVLFLLDEFPALGYMAPIEQGFAYLATYGVQLWVFVQNIGQLKELYRQNWSTFVSNAGATCYFGLSDPDLCESLSRQLGKTGEYELTYYTSSRQEGSSFSWGSNRSTSWNNEPGMSHSDGTSDSNSTSSSDTLSLNKRWKDDPAATASDLRALPASVQLVMLRGRKPVLSGLVPYFKCELFKGRFDTWRGQ